MKLEEIQSLTYKARLLGMYSALERRSAQAVAESMHPLEFFGLLLNDEIQYREEAKSKRLTARAKFRFQCELEEWDTTYDRGLSKAKLKELSTLNFYHDLENLLIYGKTGEGKTHLANAVGRRLCSNGVSTKFFSTNLLFEEVAADRASGGYLNFLKRLNKTDVLILDDFGLRQYTHEEANTLIDIIEDRYRKGSVIVTSQVDAKGWLRLFEDPVIGEAIVDRLTKPSMTIKLKGGSYRDRLKK